MPLPRLRPLYKIPILRCTDVGPGRDAADRDRLPYLIRRSLLPGATRSARISVNDESPPRGNSDSLRNTPKSASVVHSLPRAFARCGGSLPSARAPIAAHPDRLDCRHRRDQAPTTIETDRDIGPGEARLARRRPVLSPHAVAIVIPSGHRVATPRAPLERGTTPR